jgi:hypothetical protein
MIKAIEKKLDELEASHEPWTAEAIGKWAYDNVPLSGKERKRLEIRFLADRVIERSKLRMTNGIPRWAVTDGRTGLREHAWVLFQTQEGIAKYERYAKSRIAAGSDEVNMGKLMLMACEAARAALVTTEPAP